MLEAGGAGLGSVADRVLGAFPAAKDGASGTLAAAPVKSAARFMKWRREKWFFIG